MKIKGMVCGESKNVEWKEMLPKNSEKYVKTVIAFANTQGCLSVRCHIRSL